jgi:hypothetical protein
LLSRNGERLVIALFGRARIAEGRIDLAPDPLSQAPLADGELYREVRHKAAALSALGHNQLADLFGPIERFLAAAPERIEDVSVTRIWSRGNTLRLRLKAHETASVSADRMDPALIPTVAAEMLQDLVETYNVFIFRDPTGRELDQVRFGPGERSEAEATVHLAFSVVQAVQATPGLATAAAVETLTEQVEAARNAPTGIHGDQAIALSRKTSGNFIIAVLNAAYIPLQKLVAEGNFAWREIRAGTYRAAGPAAIGAAYYYYNQETIKFVVNHARALKAFVEQAFHDPQLCRSSTLSQGLLVARIYLKIALLFSIGGMVQIQRSGPTSLRQIAEALNARGINAPRGGQWHATSVRNVMARASA